MRMWRRRASLRAGSRSRASRMSSRVLMGVVMGGKPRGIFYNGWVLGWRPVGGPAAVAGCGGCIAGVRSSSSVRWHSGSGVALGNE